MVGPRQRVWLSRFLERRGFVCRRPESGYLAGFGARGKRRPRPLCTRFLSCSPLTPLNWDSIAWAYRWMEYLTFGPALHRRRREFLSEIASARSGLILGDGDGRFTAEFLRHNTEALVDWVECSRRMADVAGARIARAADGPRRVRQIVED